MPEPMEEKRDVVMKEFDKGELHSGSGEKVADPKQAYAIAMSEARKKVQGHIKPQDRERARKAVGEHYPSMRDKNAGE